MFFPAGALPASAATGDDSTVLTVEDIASVSSEQIKRANGAKPKGFNAGDVMSGAAAQIRETRAARDRAIEEARIAAEKAAEEERLRVEAEARAAAEAAEAERVAAEERAEAERREAAQRSASSNSSSAPQQRQSYSAPPVSQNAQGIVDAALAQVGTRQDCTDLVQNSLAAVGLIARRDQGGFDLGTGIWQYDRFGSRVNLSDIAPGDVLVYGNAGSGAHVAIYIGNGQAVHGGYNGSTVVAGVDATWHQLTGAIRPAV